MCACLVAPPTDHAHTVQRFSPQAHIAKNESALIETMEVVLPNLIHQAQSAFDDRAVGLG